LFPVEHIPDLICHGAIQVIEVLPSWKFENRRSELSPIQALDLRSYIYLVVAHELSGKCVHMNGLRKVIQGHFYLVCVFLVSFFADFNFGNFNNVSLLKIFL
jgi:hypothetical protein